MPDSSDFAPLADALKGDLFTPADDSWDEARLAWNLLADQRPVAVAKVAGADDVAAVIGYAREYGLRVAAQGTGHGAPGLKTLDETILVKTDRLTGVEVDGSSGKGRAEAGVIWRDFLGAAQEHGLAGLGGSSPDVGVVGYTLGGGLGWLGRKYGFSCNRVTAIELVTADGVARRVDAETEPDLFWALRGGGGNFGVVTAIEFDLIELPAVFAGSVIYPAENGRELMQSYREWAAGVPDEVTSIGRFLRLPPLEMIPEPIRDKPLVTLGACYSGADGKGEELIAPLRELGEPVMDTFATMPASELVSVHMDPEQPVPGRGDHTLIRELTPEAVDAFVDVAGPDSGAPLLLVELRQLGGALAAAPPDAGAMAGVDAAYIANAVGSPMDPAMLPAIDTHLGAVRDALAPWSTGGQYLNFAECPTTTVYELFDEPTRTRLGEVKRQWDPDELLRANFDL